MKNTRFESGLGWMLINERMNETYQRMGNITLQDVSSFTTSPTFFNNSSPLQDMAESWHTSWQENATSNSGGIGDSITFPDFKTTANKMNNQVNDEMLLLYLIDLSEILLGKTLTIDKNHEMTQNESKAYESKAYESKAYLSGCPNPYIDHVLSLMITITNELISKNASTTTSIIVIQSVWKEMLLLATTKLVLVISLMLLSLPDFKLKFPKLNDQCQQNLSTFEL